MQDEGTLHEWLLVLHIFASMVWVGGLLTVSVLSIQARRDRAPDALVRFLATLRVVGPRVFAPAIILILGWASGWWLRVRNLRSVKDGYSSASIYPRQRSWSG
jgi:putative copper export protein